MWRTIDAPMKLRLPLRTITFSQPSPYYLHPLKSGSSRFLPSKTVAVSSISNPFSPILSSSRSQKFRSDLVAVSCISSLSSAAPQQQHHENGEWTEQLSCSEARDDRFRAVEEDSRPSIPCGFEEPSGTEQTEFYPANIPNDQPCCTSVLQSLRM